MSAISKRRGVTAKIAKSVKEILDVTESISFLKLRSITFMPNDLNDLADAIFACNTIKSLRLCNIPLGDKGFAKLCRALKKRGVVDLQLRKCRLTDRSGPDMHSLISYHVSVQSECQWQESLASSGVCAPLVCLQTLDLRDNDFTFAFIREIFDPILDLPLKTLDFRGNPGISGSVVAALSTQMPGKVQPPYVGVIHRLDKPVGGIMVYAKTKEAAAALSRQVQSGMMKKYYLSIICGKLVDNVGNFVDYLLKA